MPAPVVLILAAGRGERFRILTDGAPKTKAGRRIPFAASAGGVLLWQNNPF